MTGFEQTRPNLRPHPFETCHSFCGVRRCCPATARGCADGGPGRLLAPGARKRAAGVSPTALHLRGRVDWIRTSDLSVPNRALYQAEPQPVAGEYSLADFLPRANQFLSPRRAQPFRRALGAGGLRRGDALAERKRAGARARYLCRRGRPAAREATPRPRPTPDTGRVPQARGCYEGERRPRRRRSRQARSRGRRSRRALRQARSNSA